MEIEWHGSAAPLSTSGGQGNWPTCYGYLRGRQPSPDEVLDVRSHMVEFCESNQLYLARIFHDLDVEPTNLAYPSLREVIECVAKPDTHSVLLADLEFVREPSRAERNRDNLGGELPGGAGAVLRTCGGVRELGDTGTWLTSCTG